MTATPRSCAMRAAPARAATDKKAPLRCGTNAQAAVWSEKMPRTRFPKKPKGTPSPRRVRYTALELVVREAAAAATKELQQLSVQYADKLESMIENNERLIDMIAGGSLYT